MQFLATIAFFLLCLGANAAASFSDIVSLLPDGGYMMDMEPARHGLLNITDLDGNPVQGSPFRIDTVDNDAPVIDSPDAVQTKNAWGCISGEDVDDGFWHDAGQKLAAWCAVKTVRDNTIQFWTTFNNIAYICNYAGEQACSGDEYWSYMQTLDNNCNFDSSGWYLQGSGDKSYGRGLKAGRSDPTTVCFNV